MNAAHTCRPIPVWCIRAYTRPSYTAHSQRGTLTLREGKDLSKELLLQTYCVLGSQFTTLRAFLQQPCREGDPVSPVFTQCLAHSRHSLND